MSGNYLTRILPFVLAGILFATFNIQRVKAASTIYIRANGLVEGTDKVVSYNNVTYAFTDNINDSIVVERNNITIDGNGYTLRGPAGLEESNGIYLSSVHNVTIKNLYIEAFSDGIVVAGSSLTRILDNNISIGEGMAHSAILLSSSSNNMISGNRITSAAQAILLEGSPNNTISENTLGSWIWRGRSINLFDSSDNIISGNNMTNNDYGIVLVSSSNNTISNNVMNDTYYSFEVKGTLLSHFTQSIDLSNLVNGKPIYYLLEQRDLVINPLTCLNIGYLALISCINVTVEGLTITNNGQGLLLADTVDSAIKNNNLSTNDFGLWLFSSSNNVIFNNTLTDNGYGIVMSCSSTNNIILGNNLQNYEIGIYFSYSSNSNKVFGNNVATRDIDVWLKSCSDNRFYHNNFLSEDWHAYVETSGYANSWNDDIEGNYWSGYSAQDSNYDGIGDSQFQIDSNNIDHYPLMGMFHSYNVFLTELGFTVTLVSNSTVSNFDVGINLEHPYNWIIRFYVAGKSEFGFCRICIPHALMYEPYQVIIDNGLTEVLCFNETIYDNGTCRWIYFAYQHSTHVVTIIPEFPPTMILPPFMIATLLAVIVYKKKTFI